MSGATDNINALQERLEQSELVQGYKFWIKFIFDMGFSLVMPILRRNFGERFFSFTMIFVMGAAVTGAAFFFGMSGTPLYAYMSLIALLSAIHLLVIFLRNRRGEQWHTRFEGDFLPIFTILPKSSNYWVIESIYEPLFVLSIATGFLFVEMQNIAGLLAASALLMFARSRFNYGLHKTRILDQRDSMIEGEYAMEALNGSPSKETKGYIVKGAKALSEQDKTALGKKILSNDEFEKNFPEAAKITISKDEMRATA